jgi:hypothetical protein
MYKVFFILIGCIFALSSCNKDDKDDTNTSVNVVMYFDAGGGTETVISSVLDNIQLSGYPEWITVSIRKKADIYVYEMTASANESTAERKASMWFSYRNLNQTSEFTGNITIIQFGK